MAAVLQEPSDYQHEIGRLLLERDRYRIFLRFISDCPLSEDIEVERVRGNSEAVEFLERKRGRYLLKNGGSSVFEQKIRKIEAELKAFGLNGGYDD